MLVNATKNILVLLSRPHSGVGSPGRKGDRPCHCQPAHTTRWGPWVSRNAHVCFSNSGDPKSGRCSRVTVCDPYPQTSDCNPDGARVHAGTSGSYLICGGKSNQPTNQPTNKTPELFYRKLLSSQTLSVRILLTFFLARQSIWNTLRKHH